MKLPFTPGYAVPPGETLLETIDTLGMSQADLAQRMGRPLKTINEIIKGKAAITANTALQLERIFRIPASFWNTAERNYRESLARIEERHRLEGEVGWLKELPLKRMWEFGWIERCPDPATQMDSVLQFFGVASPDAWRNVWVESVTERLAVDFRKSRAFDGSWAALAAWLRKGELEAQQIQCAE